MEKADEAIVYFNPHTIEHKKLNMLSEEQVRDSFGNPRLKIFTDSKKLYDYLSGRNQRNSVVLMMSSGNFDGMNLEQLTKDIIQKAYTEA
jgi:UDP-N-acetylmuramate: L-alanyl-gamma-D-glutamyl-meso-diaminopimelate ligase